MKPTDFYTGHQTMDLTECKVHALPNADGTIRIVARYPSKWIALEKAGMMSVNGLVEMRPYRVTEWREVTLRTVGADGEDVSAVGI